MANNALRNYTNPDDLKRDFTLLEREFDQTVDDLDRFQRLFAFANLTLAAKGGDTIKLRGQGADVPPIKETLQQKGLKLTQIQKNFDILKNLQDLHVRILHMIQQAKTFPGDKKTEALIKSAEAKEADIKAKLGEATRIAEKFAKGAIPSQFKLWITKIKNDLTEKFKGKYDESGTRQLVAHINDTMHYVGYIHFTNLVDDDNYANPEFWVMLTQVVHSDGSSNFYISLSSSFKLPGKYPFDAEADKLDQVYKLLNHLLATNRFMTKIDPKDIPVSTEKLAFKHAQIQQVAINKNRITVYLKKNTKNINQVRDELRKQLILFVREELPRNKDVLRDQITKVQGKLPRIDFVFTLSHSYKGRLLNKIEKQKLVDIVGMTEQQIVDFQNYLDNLDD